MSSYLDYKSDQVHVEYILRRRRWRTSDDDALVVPGAPSPPVGE